MTKLLNTQQAKRLMNARLEFDASNIDGEVTDVRLTSRLSDQTELSEIDVSVYVTNLKPRHMLTLAEEDDYASSNSDSAQVNYAMLTKLTYYVYVNDDDSLAIDDVDIDLIDYLEISVNDYEASDQYHYISQLASSEDDSEIPIAEAGNAIKAVIAKGS